MSKVDDNKKRKRAHFSKLPFIFSQEKDLPKQQFLILSNRPALQKELFTCISRINTICVTNSSYIRQINFLTMHTALLKKQM